MSHADIADAVIGMSTHNTYRQARTADLMGRMAERDPAALGEFVKEYGATLAVGMRSNLVEIGWAYPGPDEIHDLVMDAALELWRLAPAWRADGGASPWVWASNRLRSLASAYLGQHASDISELEIADRGATPVAHSRDRDAVTVLLDVARRDRTAQLLAEALRASATDRDQGVFLEVVVEAAAGNPRPAVTVAAQWTMTAPAVRKVVERVRRRLVALAATDARYGALAHLPAVQAAA